MTKSHFTTPKKPLFDPKKPLFDTQKATFKNALFYRFRGQQASVGAMSLKRINVFLRRKALAASVASTHQRIENQFEAVKPF